MAVQQIPARIRWAVEFMDVQPGDHVLEIGCGPGAGAELICQRLETGKLFAIDRSESGVDRTRRRCKRYVDAGRLTVRQIDLATLRVPVKRLHKVYRVQRQPLLGARVPGRGGPAARAGAAGWRWCTSSTTPAAPTRCAQIKAKASAALATGGFRVSVVENAAPAVVAVIGRR